MTKSQLRTKRAKENGVCVQCGKVPPQENRTRCEDCLKYHSEYNKRHADNIRPKAQAYRKKVRAEVIEKYGNKCECCNENRLAFLVIDHKNKDGNKERRERTGKNAGAGHSHSWYLKLRREPIRDDLRVLCYNCNVAIAFYGICPHEKERLENKNMIKNKIIKQDQVKTRSEGIQGTYTTDGSLSRDGLVNPKEVPDHLLDDSKRIEFINMQINKEQRKG